MAQGLVHSKCSTVLAQVIHAEQGGVSACVCMAQLLSFIFVFILLFAITNIYMQQILVTWGFIPCPKVLGLEL